MLCTDCTGHSHFEGIEETRAISSPAWAGRSEWMLVAPELHFQGPELALGH